MPCAGDALGERVAATSWRTRPERAADAEAVLFSNPTMDAFPRNRYDNAEFIRGFDTSSVERDGNEICISFSISNSENEEMTLYFPGCTAEPDSSLMARAREICARISELDNLVQQSCENEWKQNGLPIENYDLDLAHIEVEQEIVRLEYYGAKVNTQWDAQFRKTEDGNWKTINF